MELMSKGSQSTSTNLAVILYRLSLHLTQGTVRTAKLGIVLCSFCHEYISLVKGISFVFLNQAHAWFLKIEPVRIV